MADQALKAYAESINMSLLIVIPARYGSTRFPGKPLAPLLGIPILQRVHAIARASVAQARVIVATDDRRIEKAATAFGAEVLMTVRDCHNGTERVAATVEALREKFDFVINLQGDAVLTPPWVVSAVAAAADDSAVEMATPATLMTSESYGRLRDAKAGGEVGGTTVVFDIAGFALYFSKSVIPFVRSGSSRLPVWRHIGLYGYRPSTLRRLVRLPQGPLEKVEQLEQLRALEHGIKVRVMPVDYRGRTHWSVDSPEDLIRCENLIRSEGELLGSFNR